MNSKNNYPFLSPNRMVAIVFYILMTFIGAGVVTILIALIYSSMHQIVMIDMLNALKSNVSDVDKDILRDYNIVNALGNMIAYLIMLVVIVFYMRDELIIDTLAWNKKYPFLLWFLPISAGLFYGISLGIDTLISNFVGSSENQISIELMIKDGGPFFMFVAVVICAPIVEELIYRKAIFRCLEKYKIWVPYLVSVILFTLPHMITTPFNNPGEWFLICIPYVTSAILLCVIYHLSGKNIYASWFVHMINNLVSFIIIMTL